jgi:hypothetical protein
MFHEDENDLDHSFEAERLLDDAADVAEMQRNGTLIAFTQEELKIMRLCMYALKDSFQSGEGSHFHSAYMKIEQAVNKKD